MSNIKSFPITFHKCGALRDFMPLSQTGVGNLAPSDLQRPRLRDRTSCFYEFNPFHKRE